MLLNKLGLFFIAAEACHATISSSYFDNQIMNSTIMSVHIPRMLCWCVLVVVVVLGGEQVIPAFLLVSSSSLPAPLACTANTCTCVYVCVCALHATPLPGRGGESLVKVDHMTRGPRYIRETPRRGIAPVCPGHLRSVSFSGCIRGMYKSKVTELGCSHTIVHGQSIIPAPRVLKGNME